MLLWYKFQMEMNTDVQTVLQGMGKTPMNHVNKTSIKHTANTENH